MISHAPVLPRLKWLVARGQGLQPSASPPFARTTQYVRALKAILAMSPVLD